MRQGFGYIEFNFYLCTNFKFNYYGKIKYCKHQIGAKNE